MGYSVYRSVVLFVNGINGLLVLPHTRANICTTHTVFV